MRCGAGPWDLRSVCRCSLRGGEPIVCPKTLEPSQEPIDEYHAKLVAGYQQVFEQHKHAYGWSSKWTDRAAARRPGRGFCTHNFGKFVFRKFACAAPAVQASLW